jgi:osmotically-inducible protein OsmY
LKHIGRLKERPLPPWLTRDIAGKQLGGLHFSEPVCLVSGHADFHPDLRVTSCRRYVAFPAVSPAIGAPHSMSTHRQDFAQQDVQQSAVVPIAAPRISQQALQRLQGSGYPGLRNIVCNYHNGILRLQGRVPNFYNKQIAQTLVSNIGGVRVVINELEVPGWGTRSAVPFSRS